jgi:hypothetical protein
MEEEEENLYYFWLMHCLHRERKQPKETRWCSKNPHQVREVFFLCFWRDSLQWVRVSSFTRFLNQTQRRTTVGMNPLDEWSARRRDFYLTTHNIHNGQTSMPPIGFEPTISAGERQQTYGHWKRPKFPLHELNVQWVLAKSQGPCCVRKHIAIITYLTSPSGRAV